MKTGICTTDFENSATKYQADQLFIEISNLGFTCVQFAFSSISESNFTPSGRIEIPERIPTAAIDAAGNASAKYELPIEVINGTFNMAHPDIEVRQEGLRRFALLTEAAASLGAKYISLCSGTRNTEFLWGHSKENNSKEAWNDMLDTVSRAVEIAEKHSVTLAVESEAANVICTPEKARQLMDTVGSSRLKMILDCANLFHRGQAHTENVKNIISQAFAWYGKDIVVAHGKDILEGDGIQFCGTGLGIVDFGFTASLLKKYGFTGDMFLHGISSPQDMPRALVHWENELHRLC